MRAEILSIGTELLLGQITNTDAQYLSQQLSMLGIDVFYHVTCGDNAARVKGCLEQALSRADIVITTGGLGPTQDDLTKETVAEYFGLPLVRDEPSYQALTGRMGGRMTPNNLKQADFPQGSVILPNRRGTAPGCVVEQDGKRVIILPGPPHELKDMFENAALPYLLNITHERITSRVLRMFGIGESSLEYGLRDMIEAQSNPTIAPYAGYGEVTLRITYKGGREDDAMANIKPVEDEIRKRYGEYVYGVGDDGMVAVTAQLLIDNGLTLAVAESLTGGLVSSRLVDVPGISGSFLESCVTYSNASKQRLFGVKNETLAAHGAVSAETALEMARGVRLMSGANIGLSTTGIAGPDGATDTKPVGLVYIGISAEGYEDTLELKLGGDRDRVRNMAALNTMNLLRKSIVNRYVLHK